MSVKLEIELQPFTVPNYVSVKMPVRPRQDGVQESPKYALAELDGHVLSQLCDQFRKAVFEKAGKTDHR